MTIKTWQERLSEITDTSYQGYATNEEIEECKHAEIDELREKVLESERLLKFAAVGTKILLARLDAWEQQEPVACYSAHRLTPEGTTEFFGYADEKLEPGTFLYTKPKETGETK